MDQTAHTISHRANFQLFCLQGTSRSPNQYGVFCLSLMRVLFVCADLIYTWSFTAVSAQGEARVPRASFSLIGSAKNNLGGL